MQNIEEIYKQHSSTVYKYLFCLTGKEDIAEAFNFDYINQGYFFAKCLSRKKQLVPVIMNIVK